MALTTEILQSQGEEKVEEKNITNQSSYSNPIPIRLWEKSTRFQYQYSQCFTGIRTNLKNISANYLK